MPESSHGSKQRGEGQILSGKGGQGASLGRDRHKGSLSGGVSVKNGRGGGNRGSVEVFRRGKMSEEEADLARVLKAEAEEGSFLTEGWEGWTEASDGEEPEEPPKRFKNVAEEIRAELKEIKGAGELGRGMKLPAFLSREECQKLITAFTKGKWAFRNNLVCRVLYATGLRVEELSTLKFCDLNYDVQTIFVRSGKGDKDRYTCADAETLRLLQQWQEGKTLGDPVIGLTVRQLRRIVEKAGELTGISEKYRGMDRVFSTHSLRHAFATHSYENGMRTLTLKKLLGHEYLGTTQIYVYTAMKYDVEEYVRTNPLRERRMQMESPKYRIVIPKDKFQEIASDERFPGIVELGRILNLFNFIQLGGLPLAGQDTPEGHRASLNLLLCNGALLYEGLTCVEGLGKYCKKLQSYREGVGRLLKDRKLGQLRNSILGKIRNKLVFHFDFEALKEGISSNFDLEEYVLLSSDEEYSGYCYYQLADEVAFNYLLGGTSDRRERLKEVCEGIGDFTRQFCRAAEHVMAEVAERWGLEDECVR